MYKDSICPTFFFLPTIVFFLCIIDLIKKDSSFLLIFILKIRPSCILSFVVRCLYDFQISNLNPILGIFFGHKFMKFHNQAGYLMIYRINDP